MKTLTYEEYKTLLKKLFQDQLDLVDDDGIMYGRRWKKALKEYVDLKKSHPEHESRISTREEQRDLFSDNLSDDEIREVFPPIDALEAMHNYITR